MKKPFLLTVLFTIICITTSAQGNVRFLNRVFEDVDVTDNVLYSVAKPVGSDDLEDLRFTLYEPANDTMARRPLVITVFGGAFVAGNRTWVDMVAFADSLTHYGYVVASIDYRLLSVIHLSKTNFIRAAYAGAQDVSAAVRYFKGEADTYRIDTNQIFLLGNSAGTIASMHCIWMDDDERPEETFADEGGIFGIGSREDLGGVHTSGYSEYLHHTPTVAGVVAQWGGVLDTTIIGPDDQTPVCFIHGTADETVSFYSGIPYESSFLGASTLILPTVYGSYYLDLRCTSQNIDHEMHVFEGEEHAFYLDGLSTLIPEKHDTCFRIALNFMARYNTYIQWPEGIAETGIADFKLFPNPATDHLSIEGLPDGFTYRMYNAMGKLVLTGESERRIAVSHLPSGIYLLQVESAGRTASTKVVVE